LRPRAYLDSVRRLLRHAWASTYSAFGKSTVEGSEIRQWPAAVLAFHCGMRTARGLLHGSAAQVKGIEA